MTQSAVNYAPTKQDPRCPQENPYLMLAPPALRSMENNGLRIEVATTIDDVIRAQELRYSVFYDECGAEPIGEMGVLKRDYDDFDDICTHLIVIDGRDPNNEKVIGTYRMLLQDKSKHDFVPFYSESEFDISNLKNNATRLMEVGRSCILDSYRDRFALQLLWQAIGAFIFHYDVDFLFGCASFEGCTNPEDMALPLSYLHHFHSARDEIRPRTLEKDYTSIDLIPKDQINPKEALRHLPPLVKGYLRLNGVIGDGAYIDHQWGSIDVCIMVERAAMSPKHIEYYTRER